MKIYIFIFLASCSTFVFGHDSKAILAEKLYNALEIENQISGMANNLTAMQSKQFASLNIPDQARPFVEKKLSEMYQALFDTFKTPQVKKAQIEAFETVYTEKELKDIVGFFESPAGRAYTSKSPQLQKLLLDIAQEQVAVIQPIQQKIWQEINEEIRKYDK